MSNIIDPKLEKNLLDLGLSNKEIRVYVKLLQSGEMSAISVSKNIDLHRQFVYNALLSLKKKGLVNQIGTVRAKWRAQNPRRLISLEEEREKKALETSRLLMNIVHQKDGQEFEIIEGNKAFREHLLSTIRQIDKGSTLFMICGQWDLYFEQMGELAHTEWDRVRISRGIYFHLIGSASLRDVMKKSSAERSLMEYRIMPGLETNLVNTLIYQDRVDFEIYGDPHLTFSIKNVAVAQSQQTFFDSLWNMGKE